MKTNPIKIIATVSLLAIIAVISGLMINSFGTEEEDSTTYTLDLSESIEEQALSFPEEYIAYQFDYPVGPPDKEGYYNAQGFAENNHLGDDWNGNGGGNSDLGNPIYAIANGKVKIAEDYGGGWGKIVRLIHELPNGEMIESFYAHCETMVVEEEDWVKRGDQIATIGNADEAYYAHLHFEIRTDTSMGNGGGYSPDTQGYVDPTAFIEAHR